MTRNRRTEIEAAVAEYLARGGEISRPVATPLQAVTLRDRKGSARRVWGLRPATDASVTTDAGER